MQVRYRRPLISLRAILFAILCCRCWKYGKLQSCALDLYGCNDWTGGLLASAIAFGLWRIADNSMVSSRCRASAGKQANLAYTVGSSLPPLLLAQLNLR
jgi:hypothetical protein